MSLVDRILASVIRGATAGFVFFIIVILLSCFESFGSFLTWTLLWGALIVFIWRLPYVLKKSTRKTAEKRKNLCEWLNSLCPDLPGMDSAGFSRFLKGKEPWFVLPYAEILYQGNKTGWFEQEGETRFRLDQGKEEAMRAWIEANGKKRQLQGVDQGRLFPVYGLEYPDELWLKVEAFKTKMETGQDKKPRTWLPGFQLIMTILIVFVSGTVISVLTGYLSLGDHDPVFLFQHPKLTDILYSESLYWVFIFSVVYSIAGFLFSVLFLPYWMQSPTLKREKDIGKLRHYWKVFIGEENPAK